MKFAIPARDGMVDNHFGHCAYYHIVEVDDNKNIISESTLESPQGCGCKSNIATTLKDMGVSLMLAGNMGQGAVNKLSENGIEVIRGCSGSLDSIIAGYLKGELRDNAEICDHHDCGHHDNDNAGYTIAL